MIVSPESLDEALVFLYEISCNKDNIMPSDIITS